MILLQNWNAIIGTLSSRVSLHKIADDHIVLSVAHPSLAQELHMMGTLLCEKINTGLAEHGAHHKITSIQLRIKSYGDTPLSLTKNNKSEDKEAPAPVSLTKKELQILDVVKNNELRDALETFFVTCKQRCKLYDKPTASLKKTQPTPARSY